MSEPLNSKSNQDEAARAKEILGYLVSPKNISAELLHSELKDFISEHLGGKCKVLSKGWDGCDCALCKLDEMYRRIRVMKPLVSQEGINLIRNGWLPLAVYPAPTEQNLLVRFDNGVIRIGALMWETPGHEDTFKAFTYWDDPFNEGQVWDPTTITHWKTLT